jgi:hypothetical protein
VEEFKEYIKIVLIVMALTLVLLMFIVLLFLGFEAIRCKGYVNKTVVEVGGCAGGYCPVRYHDGTRHTITAPMVGDVASVCVGR